MRSFKTFLYYKKNGLFHIIIILDYEEPLSEEEKPSAYRHLYIIRMFILHIMQKYESV